MGGIAKQNGTIPECLGSVSDHLHLCISQLQETVHPIEQQLEQHRTPGLAAPDHTVPYGTALSRTLFQALRATAVWTFAEGYVGKFLPQGG